jgi:RNA polymerase sigma-70 factor (ECF subfamily)
MMLQEVFNTDRPLMFSIAYRMLGTTIVARLYLDRLKAARTTREEYVGSWLPEPVLTSEVDGPEVRLQRAESVTLAFLVLLAKLSPEERAVFLLEDVFEYDHAEIADILSTTSENSRQLLHRAKTRLAEGRPRLTGTAQSRRAVAERFPGPFPLEMVPIWTRCLLRCGDVE